jgi:2-succinyl-6-hydroxy-2,4-cyclohexadiene-1-carboxylate synthase
MHNQLPQSRYEIVPKAGHTIHLEQPDFYVALIRNFLAGTKD